MVSPSSVLILGWLTAWAAPTPAFANPLTWRNDRFANRFWALDNISEWDGGENPYRKELERRSPIDERRREALAAYAAVRRAHSREPERPPEPDGPSGVLLPPQLSPAERFALAFLQASDAASAARALGLDEKESGAVVSAFRALGGDLDSLLSGTAYLDQAKSLLTADAERSHMGLFLDRMKSFYGVTDDRPHVVYLLWAPPDFGRATVWDNSMILPLARKTVDDPKDLASWLGVVVHEFGHAFVAELPRGERVELSRKLSDVSGTINRRHPNVIDEAVQTALGNLVFVRDRLPEAFERDSFYSWEPDNEFPDAIDSLARELEPLIPQALAKPRGFFDILLPKALEAQARLFGRAPRHYAHAALVLTGDQTTAG